MVKTKPTKHKEENTFKFQTFAERLSAVNVDVIHRLDVKRNTVPEETETFFYECLQKWEDLNITDGYTVFNRKLGRDVQSLAQLLLNEDRVLSLLLEHIDKDNTLYLEPLLELVVAVAKDLQSDFYPHFPAFFKKLVDLLQTKEPQIIEWTFTTLAFLYKNLGRLLVKDIENVYELLVPILSSSQPYHVQQFAAESFAFIGRKVVHQASFIDLVFKNLGDKVQDSLGVGQLLFQLVRGVKKQFHTCLESFVPIYLKNLIGLEEPIENEPKFKAIEHCFVLMARHTSQSFCSRVWKLILEAVNSVNKQRTLGVLCILRNWITFRDGELVSDTTSITNALISQLKEEKLTFLEQEAIASSVAGLITGAKFNLPIDQTARLGNLMYTCSFTPKVVLDFTLKVGQHSTFESHLLAHYIAYCHSIGKREFSVQNEILENMASLIAIKSPLPKTGNDFLSYQIYPLEFSFAMRKLAGHQGVPAFLREVLEKKVDDMVCTDFRLYINSLVCLPHCRPMEKEKTKELLKSIMQDIADILKSLDDDEPQRKRVKSKEVARPDDFLERLGFVLSLTILAFKNFTDKLQDDLPWSWLEATFLNGAMSHNLFYLRAADFYLTSLHDAGESLTSETLIQLYSVIGSNITSPYSEIRLLVLHILSLFNPPIPTPPENVNPPALFEICLNAELVPIGVREQREKLVHLQNLDAERVVHSIPTVGSFKQVPLQYLLSQFYVNFRPLWEPVTKLIESHAANLDSSLFWSIYFPFIESLRRAEAEGIRDPSSGMEYLGVSITVERLDFVNARSLAWSAMSRFGPVTEKQHPVIVPMFIKFWYDEYSTRDTNINHAQDLTSPKEVNDETGERVNMPKLLSAHLSVMASFKKPKKMTREEEVVPIILRLLSHRFGDIQKLALDCLMSYGHAYLTPYREHLYRILDDKTFKSEITSFSIDAESSVIKEDHRAGFTETLIRLLYGKMMFKAGQGSTGKDNIQHRQSIILRYISGCTDNEIDIFLDLAFQLFRGFSSSEDIYEQVVRTMDDTDPKKALPLRRMQGALVLMGTMFSKLGNLMKSTLPKLLNILLNITAHVVGLLEKRPEVDGRHFSALKNLRTTCFQRVNQFFTKFERYPWTASEIEAIFHAFVWPQLEQLPNEALQGATPLLRLTEVWAGNPRYFVLFGKAHPKREDLSILPVMLSLLTGGKADKTVCTLVMDVVDKLVTTADYGVQHDDEVKEEPVFITANNALPWEWGRMQTDEDKLKMNYGSALLIPHLSSVLSYLRKFIAHGLGGRDLNVLMRVSEYVSEAPLSTELARLIIPAIKAIANKSRNNPSAELKLTHHLETLGNLLRNALNLGDFISPLAALFGSIEGRMARQALCQVLDVICSRDPTHGALGELVAGFNAWDHQRIDQPDYMRRLDTHKKVNAALSSESCSIDWVLLVLYNCYHAVRMEEDSSLKDNGSNTLQLLSAAIPRWKFGKVILNDHFVPQLRLLIRSANENVRHEGVAILSQTVENCGDLSASLGCLRKLRRPGDSELDFFENSRHLQTHRRSRALLRVAGFVKQDKTALTADAITNYLLPLATCYLFTEAYEKQNHLIDASIESLQAFSRCLSWPNYEKLLRFYLGNMTKQLQFQKQAVKAVVAILNAFHFDLKNSQFKSYYVRKAEEESRQIIDDDVDEAPVVGNLLAPKEDAGEQNKADESASTELPELVEEKGSEEVKDGEKTEEKDEKSIIGAEEATKIHGVIVQQLLPALNSILSARSKRDLQHKSLQQERQAEDEEILRVPIAVALVNLLKNLPAGTLERNLPGMFSKVCTFLVSRCNSVRETARETLIQIVISLGPQYLGRLLDAASPILQRGFQVHVYIYTVHAILVKLGEQGLLKPGSLDAVVYQLVELCKKELYGDTADEKEVAQIVNKLKEAKGVKAYDTLQILAKHVTQPFLLPLVVPFKEIVASTKSFKMTRKVEECLQNIALGLAANSGLSLPPLLIFVYGVVSLSIPEFKLPEIRLPQDIHYSASGKPLKVDSLILAPAPKRRVAAAAQPSVAAASKSAYLTNSHLIVEFGLLVLSLLLKREKTHESAAVEILPMLDPIVPILHKNLNDPHAKLIALSLRCICTFLRVPLPSIEEYAPKMSTAIFTLLHKYAGNTSSENVEMVQTAFKAISILVRHVTSHTIDEDQLRVLLTYAEQALMDPKQQSIAFGLLKSVLKRKLTLKELPDVMMKVSELAIKSEAVPVRVQSRKVVLQYLTDYPLGKKVLRYMEFFLSQLDYESEAGRLSAVEFLVSVFNTFPKNFLSQQAAFFMVTMSPYLINETSTACVKAIAGAIRALIEKLNTTTATTLFDIAFTWLRGDNVAHKRLAVQLCGIFAAAESSKFDFRLKELVPELVKLLNVEHSDNEDRDSDLLLIQTNYAIIKMAQHCPSGLQNPDIADSTDDLWDKIVHHLMHPHLWIRALSARLTGSMLGWHKADELASHIIEPSESAKRTYLTSPKVAERLINIATQSIGQLKSEELDQQLADQTIKNLVFIGKVANRLPFRDDDEDKKNRTPSVPWLTKKLRNEVNAEVALRPKTPTKRVAAYKWIAAVALDLNQVSGKEGLLPVLKFFVPPLIRDIEDDGAPEEVKTLAQEVADLIKGFVGVETYSEAVIGANRVIAVRRRDRKVGRKAEGVTNPEKVARLRMKKHFAKRVAKKVKIARLKGAKPKLKDLAMKRK